MELDNFFHLFQKQGFRFAKVVDPVTGYQLAAFSGESTEKVLDDLKDFFDRVPGDYKVFAKTSRDAKDQSAFMYNVKVPGADSNKDSGNPSDFKKAIEEAKKEVRNEWKEKEIRDKEKEVKNKEQKLSEPAGQLAELLVQAAGIAFQKLKPYMSQMKVATQGNEQIQHEETGDNQPHQGDQDNQDNQENQGDQGDQGDQVDDDTLNKCAALAIDALGEKYFCHLATRLHQEPELVQKLKNAENFGMI